MTTPPQSNQVRVRRGAIGIIPDGGRYLMVRRADHIRSGGCWCFPGGHLERFENSRQAIVREIREELALTIVPVTRLGAIRIRQEYVLAVWLLRYGGEAPTPSPQEVSDLRWVGLDEIAAVSPGLPSNDLVARMLRAHLSGR